MHVVKMVCGINTMLMQTKSFLVTITAKVNNSIPNRSKNTVFSKKNRAKTPLHACTGAK
jgi:GTP cyclohydrolase III